MKRSKPLLMVRRVARNLAARVLFGALVALATASLAPLFDPLIPEEWQEKMPAVSDGEDSMLDSAIDRRENSRLGCQISVGPEMEGLRVYLPETQG